MGRFARKYPVEAEAELYRLTLEAAPPLTVAAAVEAIAASSEPWACRLHLATARAYVRDERRRRGDMRKVERREDASGLRDRLLRVCAREVERIERAARGPRGKVDAAHVRTLGQAIRELEAGTKQGGSTRAPTREGEQSGNGSRSAKSDASNGKPPAVGEATARMLERHRAAQ